jgi:hypothetical protein
MRAETSLFVMRDDGGCLSDSWVGQKGIQYCSWAQPRSRLHFPRNVRFGAHRKLMGTIRALIGAQMWGGMRQIP